MERLERVRALLLPMPLAVALLSALPGCGGESGDPLKGSDGTPLRTPSEIQEKAQAKNANRKSVEAATPNDPQTQAQAKNAFIQAKKKAAKPQ